MILNISVFLFKLIEKINYQYKKKYIYIAEYFNNLLSLFFSIFPFKKNVNPFYILPESARAQHSWKKWTYPKMSKIPIELFPRIRTSANRIKVCVESYTNTKLFPDKSSSTKQVSEIEKCFFLHPTILHATLIVHHGHNGCCFQWML